MDDGGAIEVVRGRLEPAVGAELIDFWSAHGALSEAAARARLAEVVAVLRDGEGRVVGANSVFADRVPLIGGRRFWIYRSFIAPGHGAGGAALLDAAFAVLEEEFTATGQGPIGLCVPHGGELGHEATWPGQAGFMYMGRTGEGALLHAAYFEGALIGPGAGEQGEADPTLGPGLRIELYAEQDEVGDEDVIALWTSAAGLSDEEARRRILEVHLVGIHDQDGVVGISSAYLQRNPQLDMRLWYYRAFVAPEHRMSSLAVLLALRGRELLKSRFTSGEDDRAPGIIYEVENEGLKSYFNHALWLPTRFTFIGENAKGDHVRVHYFPGAVVAGG